MILIDASNLLHRQMYTPLYGLKNSGDFRSGPIHGFIKSAQTLSRKYNNSKGFIFLWDKGSSEYRRDLYANYKNKTQDINADSSSTIEISSGDEWYDTYCKCRDLLHNKILPLTDSVSVQISGVEADDIIAFIARNNISTKLDIIVSTDRDYYQLITDKCIVYNPISKKTFDLNTVFSEWSYINPL